MREIKFRAWDKDTKQMHEVIQIDFKNWIAIPVPQRDEDGDVYWILEQKKIQEVELMQYTGLKDKNGKEIYEGDLVKDTYGDIQIVEIGFISYSNYEGCFAGFGFGFESHDLEDFTEQVEIIGNIYENSELLKGSEEVI